MQQYYEPQPRMSLQLPRITWAVQKLILVNVAIFALWLVLMPLEAWLVLRTGSERFSLLYWFGYHPGNFYSGFLWTAITYQFLHGGLLHLFMNMLWLFIFGPEVERTLGSRQFIWFYLACGGLGVLATGIPYVLTGEYAIVIGASGATMGILVAFAMIDPQRQFFLFPLPVPITATWLVILVVLFNVMGMSAGDSNTSIATHFGGMLAGAILMKAIPLVNHWRREQTRFGGRTDRNKAEKDDSIGDAVDNIFRFKDKP